MSLGQVTPNEAIELAAKIADGYADPLLIAKKFPWFKGEIEMAHLIRFVAQEIRKLKTPQ